MGNAGYEPATVTGTAVHEEPGVAGGFAPRASRVGPASLEGLTDEVPHTVLAREDSLNGRIAMLGDGTILGRFQGQVDCGGELLIGPDADLTADIHGLNVTIAGRVRGTLIATGRLKITATGRLEGDATVGALVVEEGGVHRGQIKVHPEGLPVEPELPAMPPVAIRPAATEAPRNVHITASVDRVKKFWGELF